jgi:hypothetical protein
MVNVKTPRTKVRGVFCKWHFALTDKLISGQTLQIRNKKVCARDKSWKLVSLVRKISFAHKANALLANRVDKSMVRDASKLED